MADGKVGYIAWTSLSSCESVMGEEVTRPWTDVAGVMGAGVGRGGEVGGVFRREVEASGGREECLSAGVG